MDWSLKGWKKKGKLYAPKRKINNRGSQFHPHIIGSFFSQRNQSPVEYESLSERMFYYYLELDLSVERYYFQPVKVPVYTGKESWDHIPDTLVFRQGHRPLLYQVKLEEETTEKFKRINQACKDFACDQGWEYHVVYPKSMPEPIPRNIRFLKGFLKERFYYDIWYEPVIRRLRTLGSASVNVLAEWSCQKKCSLKTPSYRNPDTKLLLTAFFRDK
ncbi:hypothetical protein MO973_13125 [Paenibacillus sp. TRM 82003]|nr:hypothetical protein [Paenibacillus sp. TRM 82003]